MLWPQEDFLPDAVARARRWDEQERAPPEEEQWEFDQWHAKQPDSERQEDTQPLSKQGIITPRT